MIEKPCPKCGKDNWTGIEYAYDDTQHYDGVSEWHCQECKTRFGRWTHKELLDGEIELRYGGK